MVNKTYSKMGFASILNNARGEFATSISCYTNKQPVLWVYICVSVRLPMKQKGINKLIKVSISRLFSTIKYKDV